MKIILLITLVLSQGLCFSQSKNFQCPCSRIGIDSSWADSNKVKCFQVPVLRDVVDKKKGVFQIAVVIAQSLNTSKQKPLLYLHGGPGIATIENVPRYLLTETWKKIRQDRPIIFFDYRGTGFSEPALCPDLKDSLSRFASSNVSTDAMQAYQISLYKNCRTSLLKAGIDVSTFNSFQLSEDVESIRNALGISSWNIYGVSYGTTIALNVLRNHGNKISSVILDSPYPPNSPWLDFVRPFATSFKVLESKISEDPNAIAMFPSIRSDFVKAVARLNKSPFIMKSPGSNSEFKLSGDDFAWSIWTALLKPSAIPMVPLTIKEVANGNDSILINWMGAFNDPNRFGTFSDLQSKAILCYEGKPKNPADSKDSLSKNFPEFASFNLEFDGELCKALQPNTAAEEAFMPVKSKVPVLILSGEYDPVCPPIFGEITSRTLSNSTFIEVPGGSHAAIHIDECIRNIATDFLSDPLKKTSVSCEATRPKIKFVTENLEDAIFRMKK